jgi:hypothetical protein
VLPVTAIQAVDGNRKPKYRMTAGQKRTIERRIKELWRRLELKTGSPIDPDNLEGRLQAMIEDRLILPGDHWVAGHMGPDFPETIPVSAPLWYKLTQHEIFATGITQDAWLSLTIRLGINTLGDLLLHTEEEITARCGEWVAKEAKLCLSAMTMVRLPTSEELEAARSAGFWTELSDNHPSNGVRCLRTAICLLDFYSHHDISFGDTNSFLDRIGVDSIGALIKRTPEQLKAAFAADDLNRYSFARDASEELLQKEAERKFGYLLEWATASGLQFAS